jgi:phosphoserine phosphatase
LTTLNIGKTKLAVFDVEGVLIPKNRLFFEVVKSKGLARLVNLLFFGFLYEVGLISIKQALTRSFWNMRGANVELLYEVLEKMPIMPCTKDVFAALKAQGCLLVLDCRLFWWRN